MGKYLHPEIKDHFPDLDSSEMANEKKSDKGRKDSGKERPPETLQEATAVDG